MFDDDPYPYGVEPARPPALAPAGGSGVGDGRLRLSPDSHPQIELEPPEWQPRALWVARAPARAARPRSSSSRSCSPTSTCARSTPTSWKIGAVNPSIGLGHRDRRGADRERGRCCGWRRGATAGARGARRRRRAAAGAAGGRAAGDRVDDARLRPGERRLRERVHRLDGVLRRVHAPACAYWIETQVATVWRARREGVRPSSPRGRARRRHRAARRPGSRRARSSGRSTSPAASLAFVVLYLL